MLLTYYKSVIEIKIVDFAWIFRQLTANDNVCREETTIERELGLDVASERGENVGTRNGQHKRHG